MFITQKINYNLYMGEIMGHLKKYIKFEFKKVIK